MDPDQKKNKKTLGVSTDTRGVEVKMRTLSMGVFEVKMLKHCRVCIFGTKTFVGIHPHEAPHNEFVHILRVSDELHPC